MKKKIIIVISVLLAVLIAAGVVLYFLPINASFTRLVGIKPDRIEKIVVADGNTVERRETSDSAQIEKLFSDLNGIKFTRDFSGSRDGWSYCVDIYSKDCDGFIRYTVRHDITKFDGYKGGIGGKFTESDPEKASKILEELFEALT